MVYTLWFNGYNIPNLVYKKRNEFSSFPIWILRRISNEGRVFGKLFPFKHLWRELTRQTKRANINYLLCVQFQSNEVIVFVKYCYIWLYYVKNTWTSISCNICYLHRYWNYTKRVFNSLIENKNLQIYLKYWKLRGDQKSVTILRIFFIQESFC